MWLESKGKVKVSQSMQSCPCRPHEGYVKDFVFQALHMALHGWHLRDSSGAMWEMGLRDHGGAGDQLGSSCPGDRQVMT